jgi:hypothetical protein
VPRLAGIGVVDPAAGDVPVVGDLVVVSQHVRRDIREQARHVPGVPGRGVEVGEVQVLGQMEPAVARGELERDAVLACVRLGRFDVIVAGLQGPERWWHPPLRLHRLHDRLRDVVCIDLVAQEQHQRRPLGHPLARDRSEIRRVLLEDILAEVVAALPATLEAAARAEHKARLGGSARIRANRRPEFVCARRQVQTLGLQPAKRPRIARHAASYRRDLDLVPIQGARLEARDDQERVEAPLHLDGAHRSAVMLGPPRAPTRSGMVLMQYRHHRSRGAQLEPQRGPLAAGRAHDRPAHDAHGGGHSTTTSSDS